MKDLGLMHYFLGLEVWQSPERIFLKTGEVHGRNPEEIRHARMQVHEYTHGSKAEAVEIGRASCRERVLLGV